MRTDKRSQPQIKNGDILLTEIGMLILGKTDFDYVNEFHKDEEYYKMSLGIAYGIPSESTLRMRLDAIGQSMNGEILSGNISLFKACHVQSTALTNGMVPLDIDVTPFDNSKSHKEGVSRTTLEIVNWLGAVIAQSGWQFDESGDCFFCGGMV